MTARYNYSCAKCGGPVEKTPCQTEKDDEGNRKDYCGLHGWQCRNCGLGVSVARTVK